jgi:geranylgeranyl pyrophosphate synthase
LESSSSFEWSEAIKTSKVFLEEVTKEYRLIVNSALQERFESHSQLSEAAWKALLSGGKRIRPILTLLGCEAVSGSCSKALPAALAFELAHTASLIQDDIIDDSLLRHSEPTVHSKYGSTRAILVSDYLIFSMFSELARYERTKISKKQLAKIISLIANSAKMVAKGEFADILLSAKHEATEEEYFDMISLKTAPLFAAPIAAGVVVGGGRPRFVEHGYRFGHFFGIAFQIVDDVLDIVGNPGDMGKPKFKDVENHASNIVVIHAMSNSDQVIKNSIRSMIWKKDLSSNDSAKLISIFENSGALDHAIALAAKYCLIARNHIHGFPYSDAARRLEQITFALTSGLEQTVKRRLSGVSR